MSSHRKQSTRHPTGWSDWQWNEQYQRDARYREVSKGQWEWEYASPPPQPPEPTPWTPRDTNADPQDPLSSIEEQSQEHGEQSDPSPYYRHDPGVSSITQGLASTTIDSYQEEHYGQEEHQYSEEQRYSKSYGLGERLKGKSKGSSYLDRQGRDGKDRRTKVETRRSYSEYDADQPYPEGQYYPEDQQYTEHVRSSNTSHGGEEVSCPTCSMAFARTSDLERHHKTVHLNEGERPHQCLVEGCPADVKTWTTAAKLGLHNKIWHGNYSCSVPGCPRGHPHGFRSQADLKTHQVDSHQKYTYQASQADLQPKLDRGQEDHGYATADEDTPQQPAQVKAQRETDVSRKESSVAPSVALHTPQSPTLDAFQYSAGYGASQADAQFMSASGQVPPSYTPPPSTARPRRNVYTRDPRRKRDELDSRFQVHKSKEFYFGRIFKVLWSEPIGAGGTEITHQPARYGEAAFHKIRRFVIMRKDKGHSICIPILTYGYQGVLKPGVHPETHAVIYNSKKDGPYLLEGEEKLITKKPIRIHAKNPSEKLDPMSRLNYAKTYTVEHNVKVLFIGWVARSCELDVATAFNEENPPVAPSPYEHRDDSSEDIFSHAEGSTPDYPAALPISSSYVPTQSSSSYPATTTYPYSGPGAQPDTHLDMYSSPVYDDAYDAD